MMKIIKEKPACSEPVAKEIVKRVLANCFFKGCWMVGVDNSEKLEFRGLKICLMASRLKFTINKSYSIDGDICIGSVKLI